ncbi:MAG: ATP-binding protein [Gemmataceae bacterium]|nr:ATP-binding protein [Gemmataceae bacterium]
MTPLLSRWELAAETIAVKIRWFGLLFGYLLVNLGGVERPERAILNAILFLGAAYALVDTAFSLRGQVFLQRWPLLISGLEALFIALLCYFHHGLESAFRYYYLLSLICCAIRHSMRVTYLTWALHSVSYVALFFALPADQQNMLTLALTLTILGWITWASAALALLLKRVGDHLSQLNKELEKHQTLLEERIAERTAQLHEAQAHVLHQEKMAAFGLLAAGIAHEVGNPLTSISSLVQMLQRRDQDVYTREKLALVSGQLQRIQTTLREVVNFSRPASTAPSRVSMADVLAEALNIAKYYRGARARIIDTDVPADLPMVVAVRDQLVQVFLNLILNAIDATQTGNRISVSARRAGDLLEIEVRDNGCGIAPEHVVHLFEPYFTTKKDGTGLGLFVSRKLIGDHGGRLEFPAKQGQGATFRIELPCERLEKPVPTSVTPDVPRLGIESQ